MDRMNEYKIEEAKIYGGIQKIYKFENEYGASVVSHEYSYSDENRPYELAVLKFNVEDKDICYDTDITNDVIGLLTSDGVYEILLEIQKLEKNKEI